MKIAFTTLGCKLNYAETSTYERGFKAAGWDIVPWSHEADVYLINTCAVTETAEKKSRNLIRRAHNTAPGARIVVTGCYAQLRKEQLLTIDGVWKVYGAEEKKQILDLPMKAAEEVLSPESNATLGRVRGRGPQSGLEEPDAWEGSRSDDSGESTSSAADTFGAYSTGERTRSFLKVQDGCNNFCAYCTVPYARAGAGIFPFASA